MNIIHKTKQITVILNFLWTFINQSLCCKTFGHRKHVDGNFEVATKSRSQQKVY